jgi:predicted dehydrogenase
MSKPKVAVVGCGRWGRNIIRNMSQLDALVAVVDQDERRGAEQSQQYGVPAYSSAAEARSGAGANAVVIATPAETHAQLAIEALALGLDVFVEKPMSTRVGDGERMIRLAADLKRVLMVGHLLEYHGAVIKLKELVDSGELGRIEYAYSTRLNMGLVRHEENALWSFAPHDIAVLLLLLGQMPIQVTAVGGSYLQPNIADVTMTNLLFDGGVRAHIFVSWLHPFKEQKLVVLGTRKMVVFNDVVADHKLLLFDRHIESIEGELVAHRVEGTPVEYPGTEPLRQECQHFLECIETRHTPRTDGWNGLRVLSVLQASQRSIQLNGEPVTLRAGLQEIIYA